MGGGGTVTRGTKKLPSSGVIPAGATKHDDKPGGVLPSLAEHQTPGKQSQSLKEHPGHGRSGENTYVIGGRVKQKLNYWSRGESAWRMGWDKRGGGGIFGLKCKKKE